MAVANSNYAEIQINQAIFIPIDIGIIPVKQSLRSYHSKTFFKSSSVIRLQSGLDFYHKASVVIFIISNSNQHLDRTDGYKFLAFTNT